MSKLFVVYPLRSRTVHPLSKTFIGSGEVLFAFESGISTFLKWIAPVYNFSFKKIIWLDYHFPYSFSLQDGSCYLIKILIILQIHSKIIPLVKNKTTYLFSKFSLCWSHLLCNKLQRVAEYSKPIKKRRMTTAISSEAVWNYKNYVWTKKIEIFVEKIALSCFYTDRRTKYF